MIILSYNKFKEEEKVHQMLEEMTNFCLEQECIRYKTLVWMTEKTQENINPGWLKLFNKIKNCLDPHNIFNPGRWGT
jgi:FAD/FMN-containing dehydrogenase